METRRQLDALENELAVRDTETLSIRQSLYEGFWLPAAKLSTLRHFSSLEELETWLVSDDTNQMQYSREEFNCIDFAFMLQERALEDGYILSTEVLPIGAHWANLAVIGDRIYLIEPQDDRIILEKRINWGD